MPFIDVRTSGPLGAETEKEVKEALGKAISLIPGKSEESLMVQFTDRCRLWFGGQEGDIAFVNVMVYKKSERQAYDRFREAVIPMLEEKLGAKHVYLKFEETENWFWN